MTKEDLDLIRLIAKYGFEETDNDGQIVIYTGLMYDENNKIVKFRRKDEK
jgi:hypothetical protein